MPTAKIEFHRLALKEFDDACQWYAARSADAEARFKKTVDDATLRIAVESEALPTLSGLYRRVRVEGFPYILVFRLRHPDEIIVVAVAHTSRRPGYWRRRD